MIEDYLKVKTGQDLVNMGVVPKTSSAHLALITHKRLEALRTKLLSTTLDEMLGQWVPSLSPVRFECGPEISNTDDVDLYAKEGMLAEVIRTDNSGKKGVVRVRDRSSGVIGVVFDEYLPGGSDLGGICERGFGYWFEPTQIKLLVPEKSIVTGYELLPGVVADENLGHVVRFKTSYKGYDFEIPEGTIGILTAYNKGDKTLDLKTNKKIGRTSNFTAKISKTLYDALEVSSLGQIEPKEKNREIRRQALEDFLPKTVLETEVSEELIVALLMGKDMIFYGPAGSGKTNVAFDLVTIAQQQRYIFTVEECKVQCSPFSLFDEDFAKVVPPCPECMIRYDSNFKETGIFRRPEPVNVKVVVAKYGEGHGIERAEGTTATQRMHLTGFKIPDTGEKRTNQYDPEGFNPGFLPRTNNGIFVLDESDKLRPAALDNLLEALNSNKVMPDELRFSFPSTQTFIGTANDNTGFSGPFNDRVILIEVPYPRDVDTSYEITRKAYYGEIAPVEDAPVGDTHREKWGSLGLIQMPQIIGKAVEAFYIKFRKEYQGAGKNGISGSNRCKLDALSAARAYLLLDQIFYENTPNFVDAAYAMDGIKYALLSRVQERTEEANDKAKQELFAWVDAEFPKILTAEENTWWCEAYKYASIRDTKVPETRLNLLEELKSYEENPENAVPIYERVRQAYTEKRSQIAQLARVESPFMDYLFQQHPGFSEINTGQRAKGGLVEIIGYFMKSRENTTCKI